MKARSIAFIALRLLAGKEDRAGQRDQARKALRGAVLSIGLSLVPLLTVMQVADGMIQGISARYVELGTYHAQAHAYGGQAGLEEARDALRGAEGIDGAWIETQSVGVAFANGRREGAAIRAVEQGFLDNPGTAAYLSLEAGAARFEGGNDALVGSALAKKLSLKPGDSLNLITVRRRADGQMSPRIVIVTVRGIVSAGYRELDAQWLFVNQASAARLLQKESSRSFIGIKAGDPFKEPDAAALAAEESLPDGFALYPWKDLERNLFESLSSTRTMLLLIMAMTVAVAAVNVSSALTTLVMERSQEIAILKSLGARPSDLARTFSLGGALLGAAGALVGAAGGLLCATRINEILSGIEALANAARRALAFLGGAAGPEPYRILDPAYYLETIPITLQYRELALVVAAAIMLSFLAALLPARRAAALDPMEALRKR